jgi:hypothetical protein
MRLAPLVALVALLVFADQATAKEMENAVVCGGSGCVTIQHGRQLQWLGQVGNQTRPPTAAPFYTVAVDVVEPSGTRQTLRSVYVPSERKVGAKPDGGTTVVWFDVLPQYASALKTIARDTQAYPASRFPTSPTSLAPRAAPASDARSWWPVATAAALAAVALAGLGFLARARLRARWHGQPRRVAPDA